jgi:hypothetical protein
MKKHSVCAAVVLVAVISLSGCGDGAAPVQPTQSIAEPGQVFSLSGRVTDIFYHPLGGSRVEVITGPRAGTAATTDDAGRFSMPGTFTGTITVLASRDGYVSETREVPLHPRSYPPPPSGGTASWEIAVPLEPVGPVTNIAGAYGLTLTADSACTDLPPEARTRTYTATLTPTGRSTSLVGQLSDARFFSTVPCPAGRPPDSCTYNQFGVRIAGDHTGFYLGTIEQLRETAYLVVSAAAEGTFGSAGLTTSLSGSFLYCPSEPYLIDQGTWACPGPAGVQCESQNHQLVLVRR